MRLSHRNSDCGTGTLTNSLIGAGYSASYVYTNLGQVWQAPQSTSSTNSQYLYCDSSHPHQLTGLYSVGATCSNKTGQTYTSSYDAWGNVTGRNVNGTTATLSYDGLDNLTKYDAGSNSQEQYIYDAGGNRVLRRSTSAGNTPMTVYAFGLEEHLYSGSGVHQSDTYYYSLGGMLVGESTGSGTNMFLTDALGSVLETISATANAATVQGNQVYSPYGSSRYQQGTMGTAKGVTGQYNDSVSGLDYYGSRYYDPVVGRFISADALDGNIAGMDPYAYVGGNPETFSDPSGQRYAPPPGGGSGDKSTPPPDNPTAGFNLAGQVPSGSFNLARHVPSGSSGSSGNPQNPCPDPTEDQTVTNCMPMNAAVHSLSVLDVEHSSPIDALLQGMLCTSTGIGGCSLASLPGRIYSTGKSQVLVSSVASMTFCPKPADCAAMEALIEDIAGSAPKGTEESYDTGFGKGGAGGDLAGVVAAKTPRTLYHYTSEEGLVGILQSDSLNPSLKEPNIVFGKGQYFTDIAPEQIIGRVVADLTQDEIDQGFISFSQLARAIYGKSFGIGGRFRAFLEIDVTGLPLENPDSNIFLLPGTNPLDVSSRIIRFGGTPFSP